MKLALIAAVAYDNVIGADGRTPFKVEGDLPRFKKLTLNHPIIMGRKTYQSIGRPLPTRTNIVVSRTNSLADVLVAHTLDEALELAEGHIPEDQTAYVIGGGEIYRATIGIADTLEITEVHQTVAGNTYFPPFQFDQWKESNRERHDGHAFVTYTRRS